MRSQRALVAHNRGRVLEPYFADRRPQHQATGMPRTRQRWTDDSSGILLDRSDSVPLHGPTIEVRLEPSLSTISLRECPTRRYAEFRRQSFANLNKWLVDCRALASPHLAVVVVGNKLDREDEREVEYAEGSLWAQENGGLNSSGTELMPDCLFAEVSSLSGENVTVPFLLSARHILSAIDNGSLDPNASGTGISYGERQLRTMGSSSRLSAAFGAKRRRKSVSLGDMVGSRSCSC